MMRALITAVPGGRLPTLLVSLVAMGLVALPAAASQDNWNCNLQAYWGCLGTPGGACEPQDTSSYFGVHPDATDGYDLMDSRNPGEPLGDYVYAWFEHPTWGAGVYNSDWRAPVREGETKQWGIDPPLPVMPPSDCWAVKTNKNGPGPGCMDPCWNYVAYPEAASVYISWAFGVAPSPPLPLPPEDYSFLIKYGGGLSAKPAGCAEAGVTVPANWTTWDMETTTSIVLPMWSVTFQPYNYPACDGTQPPADTAKFLLIVHNPSDLPVCTIAMDPGGAEEPPATFTFTAFGSGQDPLTFDWDFGDGEHDTGDAVAHTYDAVGVYAVICTVTDPDGDTGTCTVAVAVNRSPTCDVSYAPATAFTDVTITFASGAADPDGTVAQVEWDFGDGDSAVGETVTHVYANDGTYTYVATVTDDLGFSTTCSGDMMVRAWTCFSLPGDSWHMITMPWVCVDPTPAAVFDELLPPPNPIDMLSGCLHRYGHEGQQYVTYWEWAPTPFGPITPGDGYWLWLETPTTICYRATPPGEPVTVHFPTAGWYLFGSPRAVDVPLDICIVCHGGDCLPFPDAVNVRIQDPLLWYDPGVGNYASCGVLPTDGDHYLRAFRGYWLYTFVDDVTLEIPPP